ncbi:MAG: triose-phosphate isomerase [Parvularcula sp.]
MKKLIAGNWKMNGLSGAIGEIAALSGMLTEADRAAADVLVCPPATLIGAAVSAAGESGIMVGGQDCHAAESGAHTGDISAEMFADLKASHIIVGHSERRTDHGETSEMVKAKAKAVARAGLIPIVCVGESLADREAGQAITTVLGQVEASLSSTLSQYAIAYEPVWAIGTGVAAGPEDILEMHGALRSAVGEAVPLLYGGSVKPGNAKEILSIQDVDGALVGGASLTAQSFYGIMSAAC